VLTRSAARRRRSARRCSCRNEPDLAPHEQGSRRSGHPCRSVAGQPRQAPFLGLLIFSFGVLRRFWARRGEASGSRIDPAGSTAQRPQVLDADAGRRTLVKAEKKGVRLLPVLGGCRSCACSKCRWPGWWTGPLGAVGHPFAARRGGMECCDNGWVGSNNGGDHAACTGGHDLHDPHPPRPGRGRFTPPLQGWLRPGQPGRARGRPAARRTPV